MAAENIAAILSQYSIDSDKSMPAYVMDGNPPHQTDVWFRLEVYQEKEFVVMRLGNGDRRVFLPATGKQLTAYLGDWPQQIK